MVTKQVRLAKIHECNEKINSKLRYAKQFHFHLKKLSVVSSKYNCNGECSIDSNLLNKEFAANNNAVVDGKLLDKVIKRINKNNSHLKPIGYKFEKTLLIFE